MPRLTIERLRARAVNVPMRRPLQTSGGAVATAPLVLIDLATEEGIVGVSYVFCYGAFAMKPVVDLLEGLGAMIAGDAVAPVTIDSKLQRRLTLLGAGGLAGIARAGIDIACWDALARAAEMPLVRLLGGEPRAIPAYNSGGLGLIGRARAGPEALELLGSGFAALKVRLGYPSLAEDLAVVREVRHAVPDGVAIMADYNQALSVAEALGRGRALDEEGLAWIEEPTRADDYAGNARIAAALRTPVQIGENFWGPHDMAKAFAAGSCDYVMPDAARIGGVTGWLRAAALAEAHALALSSHLYPELSAHLLAVSPTCHWLEYVDWADPILAEPLRIEGGRAIIGQAPGHGMVWNEDAVARFQIA